MMFIHFVFVQKDAARWEPIYGNLIFTINFAWAVKLCVDSCRALVTLSNCICKNCVSILSFVKPYNELIIICKLDGLLSRVLNHIHVCLNVFGRFWSPLFFSCCAQPFEQIGWAWFRINWMHINFWIHFKRYFVSLLFEHACLQCLAGCTENKHRVRFVSVEKKKLKFP